MNCNVHMFCKMIFSNKFGFILETSLFLKLLNYVKFLLKQIKLCVLLKSYNSSLQITNWKSLLEINTNCSKVLKYIYLNVIVIKICMNNKIVYLIV